MSSYCFCLWVLFLFCIGFEVFVLEKRNLLWQQNGSMPPSNAGHCCCWCRFAKVQLTEEDRQRLWKKSSLMFAASLFSSSQIQVRKTRKQLIEENTTAIKSFCRRHLIQYWLYFKEFQELSSSSKLCFRFVSTSLYEKKDEFCKKIE